MFVIHRFTHTYHKVKKNSYIVSGLREVQQSTATRECHVESVPQNLSGRVLGQLQEIETETREPTGKYFACNQPNLAHTR